MVTMLCAWLGSDNRLDRSQGFFHVARKRDGLHTMLRIGGMRGNAIGRVGTGGQAACGNTKIRRSAGAGGEKEHANDSQKKEHGTENQDSS